MVADIRQKFVSQRGECYWCHSDISAGYHVDHYMPIALGGTNDPGNLVLACPTCNMRKHDKHPDEWKAQIGFVEEVA